MRRIRYVDVMRGISIILIVASHVMTYCDQLNLIYKLIYAFHVPVFFMISGFLANGGTEKLKTFFFKKVKRLVVPYLFYALIFLLIYYLLGSFAIDALGTNNAIDIKTSLSEIAYGTAFDQALKQNSPLWFLPALFTTEMVFWFVFRIRKRLERTWIFDSFILLLFVSLGELINCFHFNLFFGMSSCLSLGVFYYLGYLLRKNENRIKKCFSFENIILLVIGLVIALFNDKVSYTDYRYGYYLLFVVAALFLSVYLLSLSKTIGNNKMLEKAGNNSMDIMIFHKIIVVALQILFIRLFSSSVRDNIASQILFTIFATIIAVILCLIIGRLLNVIRKKVSCKSVRRYEK